MSWCTGSDKVYRDKPEVVNPYSPAGEAMRNATLGLSAQQGARAMDAARQAGAAARSGAYDPGWGQARQLASDTLAGKYLSGSPQLERGLAASRRAAMGQAQDASSRLADQYNRMGVGLGTPMQQATAGNLAATAAQISGQEAQARLQNYLQERANQQAAVQMLQQATMTPAQMLSAVPGIEMQPATQLAAITQGLGQNEVVVPGSAVVKQPGALDYTIAAMGAIPNV